MKFMKKYLFQIILAAALTLSFRFTAMAAQIHGNVDEIHEDSISGWAWDASNPDVPLTVQVSVTDRSGNLVFQQTAEASIQRDDVSASGYGNGACGFLVPVDWTGLPDGSYTVLVTTADQVIGGTQQYYKGQASLRSLGIFKTTGYCPCQRCSEGWGRSTSTGAIATANHTIAVDPNVIPYGTKVMINGVVYTAEDKGGGVKGNHIDIFYNTHGETQAQGTQYAEVFVVEA